MLLFLLSSNYHHQINNTQSLPNVGKSSENEFTLDIMSNGRCNDRFWRYTVVSNITSYFFYSE